MGSIPTRPIFKKLNLQFVKEVVYSAHLEFRLKIREIPLLLPKRVYQTAKEHYFDTETRKYIAVKKVNYKKKVREMAVTYEKADGQIILVTIHPLKVLQKVHRINSGRWRKI